jgi:hypothetical protein
MTPGMAKKVFAAQDRKPAWPIDTANLKLLKSFRRGLFTPSFHKHHSPTSHSQLFTRSFTTSTMPNIEHPTIKGEYEDVQIRGDLG